MTVRGRTQAYSAGNKVYGAGRPMPTVGPVDPTGYRERDAKKMIWKTAIERRLGVPTSASRPAPITPAESAPMAPALPPPAPALAASPSGQMGAATPAAPAGVAGLPYDPAYADVQRGIANQRANYHAGLNQKKTNLQLQAGEQKRAVDQAAPNILRDLIDRFSGRGMAHSGRYATDYGEQQNQFASQKASVDRDLASQLAAMAADETNFDSNLDSQLAKAQFDYIRSQADNAGDLGLVKDDPAHAATGSIIAPDGGLSGPWKHPGIVGNSPTPITTAPKMTDQLTRNFSDAKSLDTLHRGGIVTAGNGYQYKLVNGVATRIA